MVFLWLLIAQFASAAPPLQLGNSADIDLTGHIEYLMEADELSIVEASAAPIEPQFQPVAGPEPEFGYFKGGIWLRVRVHNTNPEARSWVLNLPVNFMADVAAWWVGPTGPELLLDLDKHSPFSARETAYHNLVARFTTQPDATGALYIRYASDGSTGLPVLLHSEEGFLQYRLRDQAKLIACYALMFSFIGFATVAFVLRPARVFLAYLGVACSIVLYLAHIDGYAFQFLWPQFPGWNSIATPWLGATIPFFGIVFTRVYLETAENFPRLDPWLKAARWLPALSVALGFLTAGQQEAVRNVILTTSACGLLIVGTGVLATVRYSLRNLFFVAGWGGHTFAIWMILVRELLGIDIPYLASVDGIRYAMLWDAIMIGLAVLYTFVQLRKERDQLNDRTIAALQTNLRLQDRFRQLERRAELAYSIAESKSQQLAEAHARPASAALLPAAGRTQLTEFGQHANRRAGSDLREL